MTLTIEQIQNQKIGKWLTSLNGFLAHKNEDMGISREQYFATIISDLQSEHFEPEAFTAKSASFIRKRTTFWPSVHEFIELLNEYLMPLRAERKALEEQAAKKMDPTLPAWAQKFSSDIRLKTWALSWQRDWLTKFDRQKAQTPNLSFNEIHRRQFSFLEKHAPEVAYEVPENQRPGYVNDNDPWEDDVA